MEDKLQAYRQPLVTATGIILGFLLNFDSTFIKAEAEKEPTQISILVSNLIGGCILVGIVCLIIVLSRILRKNYPTEKANEYYQKTLNFFLFGVSISFFGVLIDFFAGFMIK